MLVGTIFGVIVIPGLYYIFGKMAAGKKLIRDEYFDPLTEEENEKHVQKVNI